MQSERTAIAACLHQTPSTCVFDMSSLFNDEEQYVLQLHQLGSNMYSNIPSDLKDCSKCFVNHHSSIQLPYVRVHLCVEAINDIVI